MKQKRIPVWIPWLTLLCMLMGFFFVQEQHTQSSADAAGTDPKGEVLISLITNLEDETAAIEEELALVRRETEEIVGQATTGESQLSELQTQLTQQQIRAGLTALEGPGVIVTVDDNTSGMINTPNADPNRFVIHYENLLYLLNDLRNAGAEGFSINGQRIVVSSEIRCVGNVILVNTTRLAPPFEISAIGDPEVLYGAVHVSTTYQQLSQAGFPVSCRALDGRGDKVTLPAYSGSFSTKNLTPVVTDEEEEEA